MTTTEHQTIRRPLVPNDSDINHWTCCSDLNTTLCGFDATDLTLDEFDESGCIVCDELEGAWFCPHGWTCPEEPA